MEQKRTKRNRGALGTAVAVACYMLIGAVSGLFILQVQDDLLPAEASAPLRLLVFLGLLGVLYLVILLQYAIHEAGHLLFGRLSGYGFNSYRVGSCMWVKEGDRVRFRRYSLAGTGGQCLMSPPDLVEGRMPVLLYNLGGAVMNVASALLSGGLWLLLRESPLPSALLGMFTLTGLAMALMNGLPMRVGMVDNDGRNALSLTRNPGAIRAFWAQMKAVEATSRGVRAKDMPAEWFALPEEEGMEDSISAGAWVLACNRLMDEHRFSEADGRMERILSRPGGLSGLHRAMLLSDRVYVELIGENRPEALAALLDKEQRKMMKAMKTSPSVLRTQYAYALLAEKNAAGAKKWLDLFEKVAKTYPYPVDVESERELMEIARQRAEGQQK